MNNLSKEAQLLVGSLKRCFCKEHRAAYSRLKFWNYLRCYSGNHNVWGDPWGGQNAPDITLHSILDCCLASTNANFLSVIFCDVVSNVVSQIISQFVLAFEAKRCKFRMQANQQSTVDMMRIYTSCASRLSGSLTIPSARDSCDQIPREHDVVSSRVLFLRSS